MISERAERELRALVVLICDRSDHIIRIHMGIIEAIFFMAFVTVVLITPFPN
jgi:hypothetical protein